MSRPRLHHTVPKFYLRRFGVPEGTPEARLNTWDLRSDRRHSRQLVTSLSTQRDFYRPPGMEDRPDLEDLIEQTLADREGVWADALRQLDRGLPVDSDTRFYVSHFIAVQFVR